VDCVVDRAIYFLQKRKVYKHIIFILSMLRIKKVSAMVGKRVFTDIGDFFGEIEDANLAENKIDSWRIRVSREMSKNLNGARGVIIPHQFIKAIGDVFVINGSSLPVSEASDVGEESTMDLSAGSV
jgi:sporulation protein YlmC with PRC-barrel domain